MSATARLGMMADATAMLFAHYMEQVLVGVGFTWSVGGVGHLKAE
jgi:hypothetical protein